MAERAQAWCQRCGTNLWQSVWLYLDPWDSVRLLTVSTHWNVPKKYGPHGELFFFLLLKKEPMVLSELVEFGPCISAVTVKTCALIGLHMTVEENALRSDSDSSTDLGDLWRCGCPKVRFGVSTALKGKEVRVLGQDWSSEVVSLFPRGLGARTGGIELPHGNGPSMSRNEGCVLGELKVAGLTFFTVFTVPEQLLGIVTAKKPFSQHGRAVTLKERDVLRENEGRRNVSARLQV